MKYFVTSWFVQLGILLVMITLTHEYQRANILKRIEVKSQVVYNTIQEKRWIRRLQHEAAGSTKITGPTEWLIGIDRIGMDKLGDGKYENVKNDIGGIKKRGFIFLSSVNSVVDRRKSHQTVLARHFVKRVRRHIQIVNVNGAEQNNTEHNNIKQNNTQRLESTEALVSCRNCCDSNNCSRNSSCRCDPLCTMYHDCCDDYETFCGVKKNITFGIPRYAFSCMKPKYVDMRNELERFWLVNGCPWKRKSDEISRNCKIADDLELNISSIRNLVPVVDKNNVTFRNEFCAKCNGIEHFNYYGFNLTCDVTPPGFNTSFLELVEFASKQCKPTKNMSIFREDNQPFLSCISDRYRPVVVAKDRSFAFVRKHSVKIAETSRIFETPMLYIEARPIISVLHLPTISIMKVRRCPFGQFYDGYLETCRHGQSIPPVKENLDKYFVAVWFNRFNVSKLGDRLPTLNETISSLAQLFNFKRSQASDVGRITIQSGNTMAILFKIELTTEQSLILAKNNDTDLRDMVAHFGNESRNFTNVLPLKRLLFFSGIFYVKISNETFNVFKTTSRQLACILKQTYPLGNYTSIQNGTYYYINSTNETFATSQVFFEESTNESISVCGQVVFSSCNGRRIHLTSDEYVKFDNLTIFYKRTERIYNFGEYDMKDGKIVMCIPKYLSAQFLYTLDNSYVIQTYLTLATFVLSLLCLFLVIQTYILFPELRNLPGKNLLSLAVSLFLAQLLWLIPNQWYTSITCYMVAVVDNTSITCYVHNLLHGGPISRDVHCHGSNCMGHTLGVWIQERSRGGDQEK